MGAILDLSRWLICWRAIILLLLANYKRALNLHEKYPMPTPTTMTTIMTNHDHIGSLWHS